MKPFAGLRDYRQRTAGGIMGTIGYLLSPLSWWNDLYVNIPVAYACAWLASLLYKPVFFPALVFFYWITNITGFILMHKGIRKALGREDKKRYLGKDLLRDVALSAAYTLLIVALVKLGIIKPLGDYVRGLFHIAN